MRVDNVKERKKAHRWRGELHTFRNQAQGYIGELHNINERIKKDSSTMTHIDITNIKERADFCEKELNKVNRQIAYREMMLGEKHD